MKNERSILPKSQIEPVIDVYKNGDIHLAIDQIKKLNEKYPNEPLLFNLIGACYKALNQLEGAAKMFIIAVNLNPNYSEAHFNLACIYQDLGKKKAAVESYNKAIKITPNYPEAHNNLGNVLRGLENYQAAIESFEWAIAYKHDFAEAHNNLGSALNDFGRTEEAVQSFERALIFKPDYSKAIFNLALTYKDLGNKKLWIQMIEKTLELEPFLSEAHLELSRAKKYKKDDPHIKLIQELITSKELTLSDRINFNFILAKIYDDIGDQDKQFKYLNQANRLRKEESGYSFERDINFFANIKQAFELPPKILDKSNLHSKNISPIFVLGMPRTGTSLVHQILSSHDMVHGAGELNKIFKLVVPYLKEINNKTATEISEESILSIRNQYLDYLSSLGVSEKIIVDKMPLNFRFIGFIVAAFPEAKIVHMNRDPIATCWSIYKNFFPGNAYSYDQEDTASYYLLYKDLMGFWGNLYPHKIFEFCYEDLTANQEVETRKLLDYCELSWDEKCINFHKNSTVMRTTSSIQVKQKMYQGSSDEWKKYEVHLQKLIKVLNKKIYGQ